MVGSRQGIDGTTENLAMCRLSLRWSALAEDEVLTPNFRARAAQLNRWAAI